MGLTEGVVISWKPKRYPMMGTTASQIARLVEIRRKERVFWGCIGIVLVLYFVTLGIIAILR